jgi:hypothetical protein
MDNPFLNFVAAFFEPLMFFGLVGLGVTVFLKLVGSLFYDSQKGYEEAKADRLEKENERLRLELEARRSAPPPAPPPATWPVPSTPAPDAKPNGIVKSPRK